MRSLTRGGVVLFELLLALACLGVLVAATLPLLHQASRGAGGAALRLAAERDASAFAGLMAHDLRHAVAGEVTAPQPTVLEHDRPVGEAAGCGLVAGSPLVRQSAWRGLRAATASRDELLVLTAVEPAQWQRRRLVAVSVAACPDGASALSLTSDQPVAAAEWVRVVEPVRIRRYGSGGSEWLGMEHRWNGTLIQPFAGPLVPGGLHWILHPAELAAVLTGQGGVAAALRLPLEP